MLIPKFSSVFTSALLLVSSAYASDSKDEADITPSKSVRIANVLQSLESNESDRIGAIGAKTLAANTTLTSLNLYDNKIGDEGAKSLANLTNFISLNRGDDQFDEGRVETALVLLRSLAEENNQVGDGSDTKAQAQATSLFYRGQPG